MYQKRNRILGLFCSDFKTRFYLREISKLSNIPLRTTDRLLGKMEEEKIIKSHYEGKHKYFSLNLDNIKTKFYLLHTEIYKTLLFLDKYSVFKSFLKEKKLVNAVIVIFGSFSQFKATKDSDLDILIISDKKISLPYHILPYKTHEINLTKKEFFSGLKKEEPLIKEVLSNHVILERHSDFVDILWWYYGK